jgi:hypothetical protein
MLDAGVPTALLAQQNPVFYLTGAEEERPLQTGGLPQYRGVHVYELESATLRKWIAAAKEQMTFSSDEVDH